jgi:hypothetical protein
MIILWSDAGNHTEGGLVVRSGFHNTYRAVRKIGSLDPICCQHPLSMRQPSNAHSLQAVDARQRVSGSHSHNVVSLVVGRATVDTP